LRVSISLLGAAKSTKEAVKLGCTIKKNGKKDTLSYLFKLHGV